MLNDKSFLFYETSFKFTFFLSLSSEHKLQTFIHWFFRGMQVNVSFSLWKTQRPLQKDSVRSYKRHLTLLILRHLKFVQYSVAKMKSFWIVTVFCFHILLFASIKQKDKKRKNVWINEWTSERFDGWMTDQTDEE